MPLAMTPANCLLGDILITNSWFVSHCGIVGTAKTRKSYAGNEEVAGSVIHATVGGIKSTDMDDWPKAYKNCSVFRNTNLANDPEARKALVGIVDRLLHMTTYGKTKAAIMSWSGSSSYGDLAHATLMSYVVDFGLEKQGIVHEVFCSELVVLAYQLLGYKSKPATALGAGAFSRDILSAMNAKYFINLDGKRTLPKDLRNWLGNNAAGGWTCAGDLP